MNRRRSERVMLQMKVMVIAEDVRHKPRREEAMTLVVNAHGGLLKMKLDLHVGQPMRLVNPKNNVEQNCRVVRVDEAPSDFFQWPSSSINQIRSFGRWFFRPPIGPPRAPDSLPREVVGTAPVPVLSSEARSSDSRNFPRNLGFYRVGTVSAWRTF